MALDRLLSSVISEERLSADRFRETARAEGMSEDRLLEHYARYVAECFLAGSLSWADGDVAMNCLTAVWPELSVELPPVALQIYLAFDAGEHDMHTDDLTPAQRTREMLLAVLATGTDPLPGA